MKGLPSFMDSDAESEQQKMTILEESLNVHVKINVVSISKIQTDGEK